MFKNLVISGIMLCGASLMAYPGYEADRSQRDFILSLEIPTVTPPSSSSSSSSPSSSTPGYAGYEADRSQRDFILSLEIPTVTPTSSSSSSSPSSSSTPGYAGYEADRNQRDFMLSSLIKNGVPTDSYWEYSKKAQNAWKRGHYYVAIKATKNAIKNNSFDGVNKASEYVQLAMLQWSVNKKKEAIQSLANAIYIMRNGEYIAKSGCEERAIVFIQKMKQGKLPKRFTYNDTLNCGVLGYIMEIPYAVSSKNMEAVKQRYEALAYGYSSMARSYQRQGESQARMATLYAAGEYQKSTGNTFSPDDPPEAGTKARDSWDACKKVYDIFN